MIVVVIAKEGLIYCDWSSSIEIYKTVKLMSVVEYKHIDVGESIERNV